MIKRFFMLVILLFVSIPIIVTLCNYAFAQYVSTAWVRRYNGPGNESDKASALAIDDSGNVYVTGNSPGSGTGNDYATIKYYPNGDTAWVRRYNGSADSADRASAIAVDGSGNVYVTGYSYSYGIGYATIKYYPNGDTAWVRTYNGPGSVGGVGFAMAIDGSSNVYVTGYITDPQTGWHYATIKYYPNGDTAWVRIYGQGVYPSVNAVAIALGPSGSVCVTGASYYSGRSYDYHTIKYDSSGNVLWTKLYNYDGPDVDCDIPWDLAVDGSGNVYVTGMSGGGWSDLYYDYATIKYYPNGDTAWVRRYSGPGEHPDLAFAVTADDSGNVYVTGQSYGWYATIKYYPNGDTAWVRTYGAGRAWDIAVDDSGNVYVTGQTLDSETSFDYATIKYYPNGDTAWVRRYDGPENGWDDALALAVDGSGNVYVTGYSDQRHASPENFDYATIKYVELPFLRGDCDKNGSINLADVIRLANYVLKGGLPPDPLQSGDVNCDGKYDLVDVIKLARYVLLGQPFPC